MVSENMSTKMAVKVLARRRRKGRKVYLHKITDSSVIFFVKLRINRNLCYKLNRSLNIASNKTINKRVMLLEKAYRIKKNADFQRIYKKVIL